jgi:hypothetical protein
MKQNPIKGTPDLARCEYRMANWIAPPAEMDSNQCLAVFRWVEENIETYRVDISIGRLNIIRADAICLSDLLHHKYGAPMIRRNKKKKYYWTAGTWMSIAHTYSNLSSANRNSFMGRSYLFMDANAAFEFKLKYA